MLAAANAAKSKVVMFVIAYVSELEGTAYYDWRGIFNRYLFLNPKSVIVYSNIFYTFAFVNDIKKWNKAVRSFVVKTVSNV